MKPFIFFSLLLLIPFLSKGQEKNKPVCYQVTVGTGIPMSTPSTVPLFLQGDILYAFNSRLMVGAGTGFSLYDREVLIPLFAVVRYNLIKPVRITPYLDCSAGYSFASSGDVNGGFCLSPAIGVQTSLFSKYTVLLALGYEMQELDRLKEYTTSSFVSSYQESLSHHSLSLKVGVVF